MSTQRERMFEAADRRARYLLYNGLLHYARMKRANNAEDYYYNRREWYKSKYEYDYIKRKYGGPVGY